MMSIKVKSVKHPDNLLTKLYPVINIKTNELDKHFTSSVL